jgi:inner membrane protein
MEPVTHFLTGACIGRAGLNRRTALATLAATIAAEAPDIDVVWSLGGPVVSLAHHRGITHTLLGAPFMALAVTGLVWVLDRLWSRVGPRIGLKRKMLDPQPIRWGWVFLTALIADLSHLLLDWTNNYGLRPFFPFNAHWYSGDIVFIAEPVIWGLLVAALVIPALLGLADREVGARRTQFRGRGWAIFALAGMVVLWCWRWAEHAEARNLVEAAQVTTSPATRIALEPYPFNPFRWHALLETADTWQTAEVDTRTGIVASDPHTGSLFKPAVTPATQVARRSRLGQVYLDWSSWPVVRDIGPQPAPGQSAPDLAAAGASAIAARPWTTVQFSDLRFAYSYLDTSMAAAPNQRVGELLSRSPLSGWVYVLDGREEFGQFMQGREQK